MSKRHKECSCCGSDAGKWEQWRERDTGYGLCARCVDSLMPKMGAVELQRLYGKPGTHRSAHADEVATATKHNALDDTSRSAEQ